MVDAAARDPGPPDVGTALAPLWWFKIEPLLQGLFDVLSVVWTILSRKLANLVATVLIY